MNITYTELTSTKSPSEKTLQFLDKLKKSGHYNLEYDYSEVDYVSAKEPIIIIDTKTNNRHSIQPNRLLSVGTKCVGKNLVGGTLDYMAARSYARTLKLGGWTEWRLYAKTADRPLNLPANPHRAYKDNGWVSMGDFLGYDEPEVLVYVDFASARTFAHTLGYTSWDEWESAHLSGKIPVNIPLNPYQHYQGSGWTSIGDFLGFRVGGSGRSGYRDFSDARDFLHSLGFTNANSYYAYLRGIDFPSDLPKRPSFVYKDCGWISLGDYLGYSVGKVRKTRIGKVLDYTESRLLAHTLGCKSWEDWKVCRKRADFPIDLPSNPYEFYRDKGWTSLGDYLGYLGNGNHRWTHSDMITFIKSLSGEMHILDPSELWSIINSNNLSGKINQIGLLTELLTSPAGSERRKTVIASILDSGSGLTQSSDVIDDVIDDVMDNSINDILTIDDSRDLYPMDDLDELCDLDMDPYQSLMVFDSTTLTASLPSDTIDFLLKNQLKKLWNSVLNNKIDISEYKLVQGGERFNIVRDWFFEEYDAVMNISPPEDYIFDSEPFLMQKLVSYRLMRERRYGNWSGTGSGKTLSAIFAGRLSGAKNTVIVCNNSTVEGWVRSIHSYFGNSATYGKIELNDLDGLYTKIATGSIRMDSDSYNYLVLNYESFQQIDSEHMVSELLSNNAIDYIILDEVQNVKRREKNDESIRRSIVNSMVISAQCNNADLLLMCMSATPITNELEEPKALIELLTGRAHDELETSASIANGLAMYKALTRYGLRYNPDFGININEQIIESDGSGLVSMLTGIKKCEVLEFEQILLRTKLDSIRDKISRGTLIYTYYVKDLVSVIASYVRNLGFSVGIYTGDDKSGLDLFKSGHVDVLIGSSPIGTGVDGIQKVCNTLIPIVMPWTSSEYKQLTGRVGRVGFIFDRIDIYIPMVILPDHGNWSWDKRRYNIVKYKATLSDLVLDGIVPTELLPSRAKMLNDAQRELVDWISSLEESVEQIEQIEQMH